MATRPYVDRLTCILEYEGPRAFSAEEVAAQEDLFLERSALFFTPTAHVPREWIGAGVLDVTLPIPSPSHDELDSLYGYRTPRLWVDLLQRVTWKLRWTPMHPARVTYTRYDCTLLPDHWIIGGTKAITDALKVRTAGRTDGRILHYFGAIRDDGPNDLIVTYLQRTVPTPGEAKMRVRVEPL
ncbi:MAG: hypothetical protein HY321_03685 [Armatimonadetes bacterium]|nr:hypothetical protein [Armatimonadota bacterium]